MIPANAHFIWFGHQFHWPHWLAVRSAVRSGGFERVLVHHADDLTGNRWWELLAQEPTLERRRLDVEHELERTGQGPAQLVDLYRRLHRPTARSNVARIALLYNEGGVYLDFDTITIRDLTPLRGAGTFCGAERLAFPAQVKRSWHPGVVVAALLRTLVRDFHRRLPDGWKAFRRVEHLYPTAINNAVIGARSQHPFLVTLLEDLVELPPKRQLARYALGTHLWQDTAARYRGADLVVHEPSVFYPLGPEISEHWFRHTRTPRLSEVLSPETRVVHWYASVRTRALVPEMDPAWVRRHAQTQLYSALAQRFLDD